MTKRLLLTGAGGFVGSHALRHLLANTDFDIICPVTFRHKGNSDRITSAIENRPEWRKRVTVKVWDITTPANSRLLDNLADVDYIWNIASESHVDRSIEHPGAFVRNNVDLMINMLELSRQIKPKLFLQMSTDEVFGPAYGDYGHKEWDSVCPSNPYSASKAAQEAIAISYWRTYGVPLVITNTMNIIGEMQDPEKFVPKTMRSIIRNEPVTVHVSPDGKPGSRFYLHARNLADAWLYLTNYYSHPANRDRLKFAKDNFKPLRYNIVGEREVTNLEMARLLAHAMRPFTANRMSVQLVNFHESRPGHDLRYALDGTALDELGWTPPVPFEESLAQTVAWTMVHPEWLEI